ncbi:recombinase family protein [Agrobacterium sp. SORGH_AS 787]|uniref:recombinase family protein n=1 Tax=Agrobacterium sp. SORGH_AS 787 TaxID=3041775 RepID=UPI0027839595|nr:DNA invertase Pin-like site-specific DNA recombinase/ssDNA-binding Zn-finger/Zn-ribbon topoisomerase 1 [Rhizobium sp. SORGH_AS_0787]
MSNDKSALPTRAYSYVRMSTAKQLRGDSLRRQLERSRAFADEHSLLLDDSLQDLGVSAWRGRNFKQGALGRFLAMVESGEVPKGSYLLIESLDRLSREAVPDALTLFMAIINAGITIATLGEDRQVYSRDTLNGDWTKLIIGLAVMSRGHEESQTKSERVRAANTRKRERARDGNGQITSVTPAWIDAARTGTNSYSFTLNDHAEAVKAIYEMAARGLGATAIARKLNWDGVPAFKSRNGWYQSIIKALLRRHDVIGTFQPHRMQDGKRVPDGDPIESYFPAVIDKELFLRVQAMRNNPGRPGRKGNTFANLFTGLCHCAHCGGPMTIKFSRVKGNENGRYLVCSNYVRGQRCTDGTRHFRYEPFEAAILDNVRELDFATVLQRQRTNDAVIKMDEAIAVLAISIEELRRKEHRLAAAIEDDSQSLETLIALLRLRQSERYAAEHDLRDRQQERQRLSARNCDEAGTLNRLAALRRAWEEAADANARYILRAEAHAAVAELISDICFDSANLSAVVVVGNGITAYGIKDGKVIGVFRPVSE